MTLLVPTIDAHQLRFWLALHRAPQIGSVRFKRLLDHFGSPQAVFEAGRAEWGAIGVPAKTMDYLVAPNWEWAEADLRWIFSEGARHHCLTLDHPKYPPLLREIADPPAVLFVRGDPAILSGNHIAVVGSRSPTPSGQRTAREFARDLALQGVGIVSGLAVGIDAASHVGAMEGQGITVAVAGTGPDRIYPRHHEQLADDILGRGGALISEYPPGTGPLAANFPRRNRIISGLALGTLVVEAAPKSGSLITARLAVEQNRDVFAVPGSIHNPLVRGCHQLIQQGAKLVQSPSDILEEYETILVRTDAQGASKPDAGEARNETGLLKYIAYEPTTVDTLVATTGLAVDVIVSQLLSLELNGDVAAMPGGGYMRLR
jgi:DNA processing protein